MDPKEPTEPTEPTEPKEPTEPTEPTEPKQDDTVSRETFNELEKKNNELEEKIKNLEQIILHANVEEKNENPFKGFSRYDN